MRFLIVSGGEATDEFVENVIKRGGYDVILAADSGMDFLYRTKILPDIIVGDFDSVDPEVLEFFREHEEIDICALNPVKDDTDTEFAIRESIRRGATEITIIGGTGTRLDHVLGNIAILGQGFVQDRHIFLLDEHNRIRLIQKECRIKKEEQYGKYVSVVSFCGVARGVSESGVFYPLDHVDLQPFTSLGISNEIVDEEAVITVEDGTLIVVESRD